jgi:RNA polymerase sigma-70 factor (ECF subfamily)
MKNLSDHELILLYQEKSDAAFIGELYKRYATLVYGLSFKYLKAEQDAEDAVLDIFEVLMEKLKTTQITFFRSWLFIVSKNHVLKLLRKRNQITDESFEDWEENSPGIFMENVLEETLNDELKDLPEDAELLQEGLESLKDAQKVCLEMFYLQQKSYQQISDITGFEVKNVKSFIQNGKRNLRIYLESKGYSYGE